MKVGKILHIVYVSHLKWGNGTWYGIAHCAATQVQNTGAVQVNDTQHTHIQHKH